VTKALFFNVPGHGHVNPSLPLVAELVKRGHHITYFITENFSAKVKAAGAVFHPYKGVPNDYFEAKDLHGGVPQTVAYELMSTTEAMLPDLLETARALQPDYILFDGMCPWGCMVARILKLPAVASLALLPLNTPPLRALLNRQLLRLMLPAIFTDFAKGVQTNRRAQALAKQYHVKPLGMMQIMNTPADLEISYTSSYFQPYIDTVSKAVSFVGRTIDETPSTTVFSFEQVKGRPLIYISLGTVNNDDVAFFKRCIEAFTGSNYYVIISTGNRIEPDAFGTLPENIAIYGWVPQVEVIKRAALFITHAGLNSVHDGLYFGVPLLLIPQQIEQFITAMRVVELGAGLMLQADEVNAESIHSNAARLLTNLHFKEEAKYIGETFRSAGGMSRAVDEIEALLQRQVTQPE
jgi:MGT family glycosyltransferase